MPKAATLKTPFVMKTIFTDSWMDTARDIFVIGFKETNPNSTLEVTK